MQEDHGFTLIVLQGTNILSIGFIEGVLLKRGEAKEHAFFIILQYRLGIVNHYTHSQDFRKEGPAQTSILSM